MILEDITTDFLSLPTDKALELIMSIRANRRISKRPVVVKNTKQPKQTELNLSAISPQMASMLLQKLKGTK